jgi:hypothetical protein
MSEDKKFCLKPTIKKIDGVPAKKWLEKNQDINITPREDGVVLRNIACVDIQTINARGEEKHLPLATTVLLTPEEKPLVRIHGFLFAI